MRFKVSLQEVKHWKTDNNINTSDNYISDQTTAQMFFHIPFKKVSTNFPPYLTAMACTVTCAMMLTCKT